MAVKALVVEDNEFIRKLMDLQLKQLHAEVHFAADGKKAIELFTENNFDIIFTDCAMPNINGFELTRMVRESTSKNANVPIIGITGDSSNEEQCISVGMNEILYKPINIDSLKNCVECYVAK